MLWKTGIAIVIAAWTNHMHCKRSVRHTISWNPPLILEVMVKDVLVTVVGMLESDWLQCELLLSSSGRMIEKQANDVPTSTVLLCCGYFLGLDVVTACAALKILKKCLQCWACNCEVELCAHPGCRLHLELSQARPGCWLRPSGRRYYYYEGILLLCVSDVSKIRGRWGAHACPIEYIRWRKNPIAKMLQECFGCWKKAKRL